MDVLVYPDSNDWWVKALRFCNLLDDQENKLSPVKVNLWAANAVVVGTGLSSLLGHVGADVWTPVLSWLTHAHTVHHFDKRERSIARVREGTATVARADQRS